MSPAPASRRGFLRGLTTLPLIGGSVALVGAPTAPAIPITGGMVSSYLAWLHFEQRYVAWATSSRGHVPMMNPGAIFHGRIGEHPSETAYQALQRAPVVLAAAGCRLTCSEAEQYEARFGPEHWLPQVREHAEAMR